MLRREPVLGRFEADVRRYVAFVAQVDDGAFLRRLNDGGGFLAEFRTAAYWAFFGLWANPFGAPWLGVGAEQEGSTVLVTLPLLNGVGDDVTAYEAGVALLPWTPSDCAQEVFAMAMTHPPYAPEHRLSSHPYSRKSMMGSVGRSTREDRGSEEIYLDANATFLGT